MFFTIEPVVTTVPARRERLFNSPEEWLAHIGDPRSLELASKKLHRIGWRIAEARWDAIKGVITDTQLPLLGQDESLAVLEKLFHNYMALNAPVRISGNADLGGLVRHPVHRLMEEFEVLRELWLDLDHGRVHGRMATRQELLHRDVRNALFWLLSVKDPGNEGQDRRPGNWQQLEIPTERNGSVQWFEKPRAPWEW